jgi:hypothetical protein
LDPSLLGRAITKWVHLASAGILVGSLAYLRFLLIPTLDTVSEEQRAAVWPKAFRKTLGWALWAVVLLFLTGMDNIMRARKTLPLFSPAQVSSYWEIFWIKMGLVVVTLGIIHLLMLGVPAFQKIQVAYRWWLAVLVVIVLAILFLSGYLTVTRLGYLNLPVPNPAVM